MCSASQACGSGYHVMIRPLWAIRAVLSFQNYLLLTTSALFEVFMTLWQHRAMSQHHTAYTPLNEGRWGVISSSLKPVFNKIIEFGSSSYIYTSNGLQASTKASCEDQKHTTMLICPYSCSRRQEQQCLLIILIPPFLNYLWDMSGFLGVEGKLLLHTVGYFPWKNQTYFSYEHYSFCRNHSA